MFNAWAMRKHQRDRDERLGNSLEGILGTRWTSETIHRLARTTKSPPSEESKQQWDRGVTIPLSLLVAPGDFIKELAKQVPLPGGTQQNLPIALGDYVPKEGDGEIVDLSQASKAEFFQALAASGVFPGARPKYKPSQIHKGGKNSDESDPRGGDTVAKQTPLHAGSKSEFKQQMHTGLGKQYPRPKGKK